MNTFIIKSLPIKEVITDLGRKFNSEVIEDCDVYTLYIPENLGEGKISGINFSSGIGIITYNCTFKEDLEIAFTADKIHPAKFLYVTAGHINHHFSANEISHPLTQHQSSIVASTNKNGHILSFPKNTIIKLCSIEIDRLSFLNEMRCEIEKMKNPLKELFLDIYATKLFYHEGNYNLRLFDMLRNMEINDDDGLMQRLFLSSNSSNILREQIFQYNSDLTHSDDEYLQRKNEVELVKKAVAVIHKNMENPSNIEVIAKTIGTNPTKLQQGFKVVYGMTINAFMKKCRLQKAANLLIHTNRNITEIVGDVGLINRGYFSKLFKEHYNCTPLSYRMKNKRKYAHDGKSDSEEAV